MQIDLHSAYVLHTRNFKESSLIVDFLSSEHGLISAVAKGAKRPKSKYRGLVQPFLELQISWSGRGELYNLLQVETKCYIPRLNSEKIMLGLYINELLIRLLEKSDSCPEIYAAYHELCGEIANSNDSFYLQTLLRRFEFLVLTELGYGIDLTVDAVANEPIAEDLLYCYDKQVGLVSLAILPQSNERVTISGATIIALKSGNFINSTQQLEAKKLLRVLLEPHIGNKPIKSREIMHYKLAKQSYNQQQNQEQKESS